MGDRIGFGLNQFWRNMRKVGYVCVLIAVELGESGWAVWARVWEVGVVLCLCVLCVWILCGNGRSRYLYIVLGGYLD